MSSENRNSVLEVAPWPKDDFAAYGDVELKPMSRIQKLVGTYLSRNWVMIPHVTHHEEADISKLDEARAAFEKNHGAKITPLAYLVKAVVEALKKFPQFNSSLDPSGEGLVLKKYFHIGYAVDTPNGLIVPVIHNADKKSVAEIAKEIVEVSAMARSTGIPMELMSGGCFTISSLGSLGGTGFTPIINAPQVATLGISRAFEKPLRGEDGQPVWRSMLPLSLSYDHRVINGADAARFCTEFSKILGSPEALENSGL